MARTIAMNMVDHLVKNGVQRVYGVPGDSLNGFTDALRRDGTIQWVHVRHEEAAAFAAGAEAEITGELAVCAGSCGPGNLHLINGLFDANRTRVPVLAIAAQIPSQEIGSTYFQETHPQELFRECSVYSEFVGHPSQMPRVLEIAMRTAIEKRGVAVVVIPGDVGLADIDAEAGARASRGHFTATVGEFSIEPGAANVIPNRARLLIDARSADRAAMEDFVTWVETRAVRLPEGISGAVRLVSDNHPTRTDAGLLDKLAAAADRVGATHRPMVSGAGHDTAFMARIAPAAMVFVPSRDGRSHCAEEFTENDSIAMGAEVLAETVLALDAGE